MNKIYSRALCAALVVGVALAAVPESAAAQPCSEWTEPPPGLAGTVDPGTIPKYVDPLVIPPAMPRTSTINMPKGKKTDYYEIAVRQFDQPIMPSPCPATTVWSYGSVQFPGTVAQGGSFNYPAFTIEAKWEQAVRVKWINDLVDANGDALPHLLPVDQTLHWANPAKATVCKSTGAEGTDCRTEDPAPYEGPVPMVVHVHGAETTEDSDGYPEAWYLPAGVSGDDYALGGSFYETFKSSSPLAADWTPGSAVFEYPNAQEATTLWYHDHSLGMTRLNVYAGPAGFYLLRGGPGDAVIGTLPGPAPALGDPPGLDYYEIPIAVQDRSFNSDGSLFYPDNRAFFQGLNTPPTVPYLYIPFIPDEALSGEPSDVSPIWNPEFFGNTLVTNGKTWPTLNVEKRRYRMRLLNGSQSRFLILQFSTTAAGDEPDSPATDVGVWQIGAEQGFLPAPVNIGAGSTNGVPGGILLGPAERADMIIDFSALPEGTEIYLRNWGPDEPFGGGDVGVDFDPPSSDTSQVMKLTVVKRKKNDKSTPADQLILPAPPVLGAANATRTISLNELESETVCVIEDEDGNVVEAECDQEDAEVFGPTEARLGTLVGGEGNPLGWADPTTENVMHPGDVEQWEMYNFTADAHPIHIHLIQFQVVERQLLAVDEDGETIQPAQLCLSEMQDGCGGRGPVVRAPEVWETGYKDTVISYPGEVTRVIAEYPLAGLFVWHCHILEHEDNEMMRPYCVGNTAACQQHNGNGE